MNIFTNIIKVIYKKHYFLLNKHDLLYMLFHSNANTEHERERERGNYQNKKVSV